MDVFEYLPQLIVAYDGNDKFANLIHVSKSNKDNDYYCPCCGGIVKPRALHSKKEQSHYYHKTGKCSKESQLHFFCKNWLFEKGSKFCINGDIFKVDSIDIEKSWPTKFGDYKPDITVYTTSGKIIYFEMFFSNRKNGDDYFCKWDALGNDVVEVNIKEYMFKTDEDVIPSFAYLYHDSICYSKSYVKKDLYANTIARIKDNLTRQKMLNYKSRNEQLDWFWQKVRLNESKDSILDSVKCMDYEDMVSCYSIIKRKQCVSYLKDEILEIINKKVVSEVRESLNLPYDENVYFDLIHIHGRTYEAGIRLDIKTTHISYNKFRYKCLYYDKRKYSFEHTTIVFSKNVHDAKEVIILGEQLNEFNNIFRKTLKFKDMLLNFEDKLSEFEGDKYKIRINNDYCTVLSKTQDGRFEVVLDKFQLNNYEINSLSDAIQNGIQERKNEEFLKTILSNEKYQSEIRSLKNYKGFEYQVSVTHKKSTWNHEKDGIYLKLYVNKNCEYNEMIQPNFYGFIAGINKCKVLLDNFVKEYDILIKIVGQINACKNGFWKAKLSFDFWGNPEIKINQTYIESIWTESHVLLHDFYSLTKQDIISKLENAMHSVLKNMEKYGCYIMEVKDNG